MAGNSMGGWMALEAAKRGMARSVVALGPAGLWATGMPRSTQALFGIGLRLAWISQTSARHVLRVPSVRAAALRVLVKHPHRMTTGDAIGLLADLHTSSPALRKALALNVHNRFEGGQHITVRVTVAIGSHDRMVPARTSRFRDQLPAHTRWVTLPDCGHLPMWDHPDLVVRTILEGTAKNTVSAAPRA
jgi:pimeloyl-ACP methyl ester carboxylesterase